MAFYQFGIGYAVVTPYGSNAAGNPTPTQLITLQDISVDCSFTPKPLMGQLQWPVAIARGEGKMDIKAKYAKLSAKGLNDLNFGNTVGTGQILFVPNESHTAAASITITPPGGGTFDSDQGVIDANGNPMVLHATPAVGQYSVTGAVYTFNASQTGPLFISYTYSIAGGAAVTIVNRPMGAQPVFNLWIANGNWSNNLAIRFPACIATKVSLPQKNTDWTLADQEFGAFSDSLSNIAYLYADN